HNLDHYKDTQDQIRWQEDQILSRFYMQKIVLKNFPPGDDSLRAFYARVKTARYSKPGDVNVQEIYFDNPDTARAVRKQLDNGGDFSALATRYTKRATAKDTSGYLGWFKTNRYGAIGQKAAEMTPGQIEGPFTVGTGWSIIKLIDKKPGESKSFESIKNTVKQDYIDTYRPQLIEKNIKQLEEKYHSELHYQALDSIS
ncbi:MAG TPA: peptidyl-prolyl cis-trans isomerase, partial [Balneolales bacterium]|nr:peptidyl-prolyl cis-trans isomerase [Balneolales bacterium]